MAGESARFFIGVAGWSLPSPQKASFPGTGSHLERYASRLRGVEINSSFYRHHRGDTYARWAASVPEDFRFAVKLAREFTHHARFAPAGDPLRSALTDIHRLDDKLAVLLVQLPPSLAFDRGRAERFLGFLREHSRCDLAWEPRHPTWASDEALGLLEKFGVAKVVADPEPCPTSRTLSSDRLLRYYRLHGSPEKYRSAYRAPFLRRLAATMLAAPSKAVWCVFDNTTFGFALENALELRALTGGLAEHRIVS